MILMLLSCLKPGSLKATIFILKHLLKHQLYHGVNGKTLKHGWGFYLKSGIKFKATKHLDMSYFNENSKFKPHWIENLHKKQQNILIGVYYQHTKKSLNEIFFDKLKQNLQKNKKM